MSNSKTLFREHSFALLWMFMVPARETNEQFQRLAHYYFIPYLAVEMKINLSPVPVGRTSVLLQ